MSADHHNRSADARPKRREGVAHDLDDDGAVALFDRAGLRLLVLDPIGAGVWTLADGTRTCSEITDELLRVYATEPRERVLQDVETFLATLARDQLLDFV